MATETEHGVSVGKTKLMKLLYLLDIEYYRYARKTYTELHWVFYKYGPFAFELESFIQKFGVGEEPIVLDGDKSIKKLSMEKSYWDIEDTSQDIDTVARGIIESLWKEWGDEDLNMLLDFVYFETEPMQDVKRMAPLDFSKVFPTTKNGIEISPATKLKLETLSRRIKKRLEAIDAVFKVRGASAEGSAITSIWDTEATHNLSSLKGIVKFKKENADGGL